MERALPLFGFWIFLGCVAVAIGLANMNPGPSALEINAMARKDVAVRLAERGATPAAVQCILDPPIFSSRCRDIFAAR
jgi:hypothetical protein